MLSWSDVYEEINLIQGDQRNTSHTRCISERSIQDLGSSQTDCLQTSAEEIKDPYEKFSLAAPAMLPASIADLMQSFLKAVPIRYQHPPRSIDSE